MTNEAVLLRTLSLPVSFTCADGAGIEKGALLTLSDPNTAALATASFSQVAGICSHEKNANDGIPKVSAYRDGDFKVLLSGAAFIGNALCIAASTTTNAVCALSGGDVASGSVIIGVALESRATGGTIRMRLQPMVNTQI